jgi:hypothetical protein
MDERLDRLHKMEHVLTDIALRAELAHETHGINPVSQIMRDIRLMTKAIKDAIRNNRTSRLTDLELQFMNALK